VPQARLIVFEIELRSLACGIFFERRSATLPIFWRVVEREVEKIAYEVLARVESLGKGCR
jgi:hypothetical protein